MKLSFKIQFVVLFFMASGQVQAFDPTKFLVHPDFYIVVEQPPSAIGLSTSDKVFTAMDSYGSSYQLRLLSHDLQYVELMTSILSQAMGMPAPEAYPVFVNRSRIENFSHQSSTPRWEPAVLEPISVNSPAHDLADSAGSAVLLLLLGEIRFESNFSKSRLELLPPVQREDFLKRLNIYLTRLEKVDFDRLSSVLDVTNLKSRRSKLRGHIKAALGSEVFDRPAEIESPIVSIPQFIWDGSAESFQSASPIEQLWALYFRDGFKMKRAPLGSLEQIQEAAAKGAEDSPKYEIQSKPHGDLDAFRSLVRACQTVRQGRP